jgi:hypothetical protein
MARLPIFLPNKGIVLNKPEEFLTNNFSSYSRNVEFWNEELRGRNGLGKFDAAALPDRIQRVHQFWQFDGTWDLVFFTPRDIAVYDFGNTRFDYITPQYTTGSITIAAGALTTVEGAGVNWSTGGIKAGDFIKIGSGNVHSGSTWYEIKSVTDADTLVLETNGATCAGSAYVIRKTFSGSDTDYWDSVTYQDENLGSIVIGTNGIDMPVYWTGSGLATAISGVATGFTAAKWVSAYKDRVIFFFTTEGGATQAQRVRWSGVADVTSWSDIDFKDFTDEDTWISGHAKFGGYLVVFKEAEAYIGRWVGLPYVFDWEKSESCSGTKSRNSIVADPGSGWIYYYANDNRFKRFNLLREDNISDDIYDDTKNFDPNLEQYIFGTPVSYKDQIRWLCPKDSPDYNDYVVVWDTQNEILNVWKYEQEQALCSAGEYTNLQDLYVDDSIWGEYYVDEVDGFWDDRTFLSGAPIPIYCGYDGYVRNADSGADDDGTAFERRFDTSRLNFGSQDLHKRVQDQEWWFAAETSGTVTISCFLDDNNDAEVTSKSISLVETGKDVAKNYITWNKRFRNIKFSVRSTNHFSLLGFISNVFIKGKAF